MPRGEPKFWLEADEEEARLAGLRLTDLAGQLQGNLEGYTGGSVLEGIENLPVRVRFESGQRDDIADFGTTVNRTGDCDVITRFSNINDVVSGDVGIKLYRWIA